MIDFALAVILLLHCYLSACASMVLMVHLLVWSWDHPEEANKGGPLWSCFSAVGHLLTIGFAGFAWPVVLAIYMLPKRKEESE